MSERDRYRKVLGIDVPPAKPSETSSKPPPGEITIAGRGWKFSAPAAILLALGSALASAVGTRMLPTPSTTDNRIDHVIEQQNETKSKMDKVIEQQVQGLVQARDTTTTLDYVSKRLTLVEDRFEAHETREREERERKLEALERPRHGAERDRQTRWRALIE